MIESREREYLESARVGRLATADGNGRPHVVPICYALLEDRTQIVTPIDEKPKRSAPNRLTRVRNVAENPRVSLVVDHYSDDWAELGWVLVRGTATTFDPSSSVHSPATSALRDKYEQYATHDLESRPILAIDPGSVRSWGRLER